MGVVRSAAERGPDHTPESGSRPATVGGTEMGRVQEENVVKH